MKSSRIAGAVAAGIAAVVLVGCGPSSGSAAHRPTASAVTTTSASPSTAPTTPATTPPTTPATTPPTTPPTTRPPTTPAAPATHRATHAPVRRTAAPPAPATTRARRAAVCSIRSNAGNCYQAGQFCRNSDLGSSTTDASGRRITCGIVSGRGHWHY